MRGSGLLSLLLLLQARGRDDSAAAGRRARGLGLNGLPGRRGAQRCWRPRCTVTPGTLAAAGCSGAVDPADPGSPLPGPGRCSCPGCPALAARLGLGSVLAAAMLKLRAALPASLRENAGRLSERFYLDVPGWYRRPQDVPRLPAVAGAAWDRQVIQVTGQRWKEPAEVTRRLEPHGLVLKAGIWSVAARCDSVMRTYRASQILTATPADCGFPRRARIRARQLLAHLPGRLPPAAVHRARGDPAAWRGRPAHAPSAQRRGRDRGPDRRRSRCGRLGAGARADRAGRPGARGSPGLGPRAPVRVRPLSRGGSRQPICSARATMMPAGPRR